MDSTNEIDFKNENPGAVRYGNFINYYQFHSPESRIKLLPTDIWKTNDNNHYFCLDIGCNAGDLTIQLYEFLRNMYGDKAHCNFLGIDVDPTLILRAKEIDKHKNNIEFHCLDFMNDNQTPIVTEHLKKFNKSKFNVTFCFSITMWIHLNHGDDGLKKFIEKVCYFSDIVVIEPQPWKCYRTAVKRLKQANSDFPLFKTIVNRQNVEDYIEKLLQQCDFVKIFETPRADWERKILFYERGQIGT